jgi:serine/threonine protein kinase
MAPGESRYRILRTISDQGATEILEAVALGAGSFERRVVMKRARPEARSEDPEFVERFLDEARIASQLHHANVVSVLDFGVGEGGAPFLVMDFVDGLDVGALTKRGLAQGRPITPSIAVHVTREIAHGLAYAHAALDREGQPLGIVHRDIAPGNVLISWDGDVLLTDFGIARAHARATRTAVGETKGTLDFMAPEQLLGGHVDQRTDIYALGSLLHFLLTGKSPTADLDRLSRASGARTVEASLPPALRSIIERATSPKRSERHADARALAAELWRAWLGMGEESDARSGLIEWLSGLRQEPKRAPRGALDAMFALESVPVVLPPQRPGTALVGPPLLSEVSAVVETQYETLPPFLQPRAIAPEADVDVTRRGRVEWSAATDGHEDTEASGEITPGMLAARPDSESALTPAMLGARADGPSALTPPMFGANADGPSEVTPPLLVAPTLPRASMPVAPGSSTGASGVAPTHVRVASASVAATDTAPLVTIPAPHASGPLPGHSTPSPMGLAYPGAGSQHAGPYPGVASYPGAHAYPGAPGGGAPMTAYPGTPPGGAPYPPGVLGEWPSAGAERWGSPLMGASLPPPPIPKWTSIIALGLAALAVSASLVVLAWVVWRAPAEQPLAPLTEGDELGARGHPRAIGVVPARDDEPASASTAPVPAAAASPEPSDVPPMLEPLAARRRPTARTPAPSLRKAFDAAAMERQLDASLAARGVRRSDVARVAPDDVKAFTDALAARDVDGAHVAMGLVMARAHEASLTREVLSRRLERLGERLVEAGPSLEAGLLRTLESGYFELRTSFPPPRSGAEQFQARLAELERKLGEAGARP